jgi:hypothetical protein
MWKTPGCFSPASSAYIYQNQAPSKWKVGEDGKKKVGGQLSALNSLFGQFLKGKKNQRKVKLGILSLITGREINSSEDLTKWEASCLITYLKTSWPDNQPNDPWELSLSGRNFLEACCGNRGETPVPKADPDTAADHQETDRLLWSYNLSDLLPADEWV